MTELSPHFTWEGWIPLEERDGPRVEVRINLAIGLEFPDVRPNDPLPESGPALTVEVAGGPAQVYHYVTRPRGLRGLYSDRLVLSSFCLYTQRGANTYLFRLAGDQGLRGEASNRFRSVQRDLESRYLARDAAALGETAFLRWVETFLTSRKALHTERSSFLTEVAAEVDGNLTFPLGEGKAGEGSPSLNLAARPGARIELAVRMATLTRKVRADRIEERLSSGRKGTRVTLRTRYRGEELRLEARTDAEGWAVFPSFELPGPRRLVLEGPDLRATLSPRWGREVEARLSASSPWAGAPPGAGVDEAAAVLLRDLESAWDPDVGALRDLVRGQYLERDQGALEALAARAEDSPLLGEAMAEAGAALKGLKGAERALPRYLWAGLSAASLVRHEAPKLKQLQGEPSGVWTLDACVWVQGLALAARLRPQRKVTTLALEAAEELALRVGAELEPTWHYQAFRRPVKTFRANPDVAQPHAEAILALLRAADLGTQADAYLDLARAQGAHLEARHSLDGEPPGYVLGSWKERARLETPARLGLALEALGTRLGEESHQARVERTRKLVWQRFLSGYHSADARDRVRLLHWLGGGEAALR